MHVPCIVPPGMPFQCCPAYRSEICAVDGFQLVAVRVAHGVDADHTGQLGGEGVASEGGRQGHGTNICTPSMPTNSRLES